MSLETPPSSRSRNGSTASPYEAEQPTFPVTRPDYTQPMDPVRSARARERRNLLLGLGFLAPNILGFLAFTAIPLVFSMVLAFTNWDLKLHNRFKPDAEIEFVGLSNFVRLLNWNTNPDFYRFLGNTLYFMMGMPFAIAASLISAILLSKDLKGGSTRVWIGLVAGAGLIISLILLTAIGMGGSAMVLLIGGLACGILIMGVAGGSTVYRTLFYVPHFTAGVATYLLWKKLYNPTSGPITMALQPPLNALTDIVRGSGETLWQAGGWFLIVLMLLLLFWGGLKLRQLYLDGDIGSAAAAIPACMMLLPAVLAIGWLNWMPVSGSLHAGWLVLGLAAVIGMVHFVLAARGDQTFVSRPMNGVGSGLMLAATVMVAQFVLMGLAATLYLLPQWAADSQGLETPKWLNDIHWAKPSIMIMSFWGAVGSNNMLLYLAALTNVPQELYEAADIDGASRFQKFWNVTWPQLAPTTFFIVVMGVIGGLQGGFEMARVMTQGGPAGQTTTLAYFIYTEGFETGRLGFSSAVAWTLFLMVLLVTLFNWKFGNKYVND